jgi:hypothetical protein
MHAGDRSSRRHVDVMAGRAGRWCWPCGAAVVAHGVGGDDGFYEGTDVD